MGQCRRALVEIAFLLLVVTTPTIAVAIATTASETRSPQDNVKPWESDWQKCLERYKSASSSRGRPNIYRHINGKCGELEAELGTLPEGACFMAFVGPSDILRSRGYEVLLQCMKSGKEETACTNRSDFYSEEYKSGMRRDVRCRGFPKLVSVNLGGGSQTSSAPMRQKESEYCRKKVATIRRLENDPSFDLVRSVRLQWQLHVEEAMRAHCDF